MRNKKEIIDEMIKGSYEKNNEVKIVYAQRALVEVLLDIRDLLIDNKKN